MARIFVNIVFFICIWTEIYADPAMNTSMKVEAGLAGNEAAIHQQDAIPVRPMSNDFINSIQGSDRKPVGKRFGLILSKLGPLGNLFFGIYKSGRKHAHEDIGAAPYPVQTPLPQGLIFQDAQGPGVDHSHLQAAQQQDYLQQINIDQQLVQPAQYQPIQPSLELSIKGPPVPNIQPWINKFPGVLINGYKSFLDKISSTSIVWDKSIKLPFISIQKTGRIGATGTGSMVATNMEPPSSGIYSGHIDSLVDIRDPYIT